MEATETKRKRVERWLLHEAVNPNVQVIDNGKLGGVRIWNFMQIADESIGSSSSGLSRIVDYQSQFITDISLSLFTHMCPTSLLDVEDNTLILP